MPLYERDDERGMYRESAFLRESLARSGITWTDKYMALADVIDPVAKTGSHTREQLARETEALGDTINVEPEPPVSDSEHLLDKNEEQDNEAGGGGNDNDNDDDDDDEGDEDQFFNAGDGQYEDTINAFAGSNLPEVFEDADTDSDNRSQDDQFNSVDDAEEESLVDAVFDKGWDEGYSYGFADIMTIFISLWYSKASTRFLLDFTFGFSDGLFVPFFVTAGLASLGDIPVAHIILVGLVQICAGCLHKIVAEVIAPTGDLPADRVKLTRDPNLEKASSKAGHIAKALAKSAFDWVASAPSYAYIKRAETISLIVSDVPPTADQPAYLPLMVGSSSALGYLAGGLLPLLPYFFLEQARQGLVASFAVRVVVSFVFAFARRYKIVGPANWEVANNRWRQIQGSVTDGGFEVFVGVLAAALAVICAKTSARTCGL
jgi:vacuolar iron transporter family protein